MVRIFLVLLIIAVFLFGLAFHLKNDQMVTLNFYLGSLDYYFSVFVVSSLIIGALLGLAASLPLVFRLKHENRKLHKRLQIQDKEVKNLRSIPIKDSH